MSQKGFQIGVGLSQIITNSRPTKFLNQDEVKISNLYGASLNVDYSFSNKFRIKSGLEYKLRNIDFENLTNYRAEYISIPLILNYNFLQMEKSGLTIGIDAGVSFDKPVFQSIDLKKTSKQSDINKETITTLQMDSEGLPARVFEFSDYISFRFGVSAKYNLGKRGQLNFFAQSTSYGVANILTYKVNEQVSIDGKEISNKSTVNDLDISNKGIQFGLYYTFGTLTFK
jgi:hypothetical protein